MTFNLLTKNEEHDNPSQFLEDNFWIAWLSYILNPNKCKIQSISRVLRFQILVLNWQI